VKLPADWIVPDWPVPERVRALITTRSGGASRGPYASFNLGERVGDDAQSVASNRETLRRLLPAEPAWMQQVHGIRVIELGASGKDEQADAAVARAPGQVCVVLTADCVPVLLADVDGTVVGVAHAGWRGLAAGVIENAVRAMRVAPDRLIAYLGPGIGAQAYEVGTDVVDAMVAVDAQALQAFSPRGSGKFLADLCLLARQRLERLGVTRIHGGSLCTYSDAARFYSFRRDGVTGRMASLIWLE